ncbi:MAG: adenylyltransferase/cytidyltransferase family protein [Armatimonadota bacterium]
MSVEKLAATAAGKTVIAAGPLYTHRIVRTKLNCGLSDRPMELQEAEAITVAGGVGRLAEMLKTWGATVELAGCIGGDNTASDLAGIIQQHDIGTRCLVDTDDIQTPVATDVFYGEDFFHAHHLTHTDFEPLNPPGNVLAQLRDLVMKRIEGADMVITVASDHSDPVAETVCQAARDAGLEQMEVSPGVVDLLPMLRSQPAQKPKTLPELEWIVRQVRHFGGDICFTNGCFDLLHAGHVTYLQRAAACADRFILALNSDESIRKIKGAGRPVLQERDRLQVLAALECVDYITVFESEDVIPLLEVLRPEVYVKGGDYTINTINQVERRFLAGYGAEIVLLPGVEGASTTEILRRIHDEDVY